MAMRKLVLSALAASGVFMLSTPASAEFDAAGYYKMRCSNCHGDVGQGTRHLLPSLGPALKGNPFVANGSVAAIRTVIRKGRQGERRLYNDTFPNMPSFGSEAIPDVEALIGYLKGPLQQ